MRSFFQKINADTIGMKAMGILSEGGQRGLVGTVHSVFSHSFNVIGASGLIAAVCGNFRHPAAVNLAKDAQSFLREIRVGWNVQREPWGFSILKPNGEMAMSVDIQTAQCWDGVTTMASRHRLITLVRPQADTNSSAFNKKVLGEVGRAYTSWGHGTGLGDLIPAVCGQTLEVKINKLSYTAWVLVARLIFSLKQNNLKRLCSAVWSLLGMGPGLTPSGDDLLGGLMARWVLVENPLGILPEQIATLHRIISKYSAIRTSTLSRHLLNYAAEGLVGASFYLLICAMVLGTNDVLMRARAAFQWGGTSGEDTTLGICLAFRLAPGCVR